MIEQNMRAILAGLSPATGNRATGTIAVYGATGAVRIPRGTYAVPLIGSTGASPTGVGAVSVDYTREVKAAVTGISGYFSAAVTGTYVPFVSNLGGARHNFPAGTRFIFEPPVAGLTGVAWTPSGFGGGTDSSGFGTLRDVVIYENLDGPAYNVDLARSGVKAFPAAVLVWNSFDPADGSTVPTTQRSSRGGGKSMVFAVNYTLHILCSRVDAAAMRSREALRILEAVVALLSDAHAFDHEPVSNPGGLQVRHVYRSPVRQDVAQRLLVYSIDFGAMVSVTSAPDRRYFADWLLTRIQTYKSFDPDTPEGAILIADISDVTQDMQQNLLDVGLEEGGGPVQL